MTERCSWNDYGSRSRGDRRREGLRLSDLRRCEEPGEIQFDEGPLWLCPTHAAALERIRQEQRLRARAAYLRGLG